MNREGDSASTNHLDTNSNLPRGYSRTRRVITYREGDSVTKTPGHQHTPQPFHPPQTRPPSQFSTPAARKQLHHSNTLPPSSAAPPSPDSSTLPRPAKPPKSGINQTTRKAIQHQAGHFVAGGSLRIGRVILYQEGDSVPGGRFRQQNPRSPTRL